MTAIRVNESSGSVGVIQAADGFGSYLPTNILFNTQSSGLAGGYVLGTDVAVFVSGTMGSKGTTIKGVSLFSGDVVVSGTLYAERQVIEVDEVASGHLLVSGTFAVQDSITANAAQVLFLSGGAGASLDETKYPDVNIYFSGSKSSAGSTVRGTALFGGDVVISGTLHGGSPLKIAGGMVVAGATEFADAMEFKTAPVFKDGFNVSGGSGIFAEAPKFSAGFTVTGSTAYDTAPRFDAGFNVSAGEATFAGATTFNGGTSFEAAPTFEAGFSVTGSTAYETAPTFDAGFNVAGGQASFTEAPSFAAGFQLTGSGQVAGTINIGDPEDGSYTDGLFADIDQSTLLGTVVDRFNEVLKALAPAPAPSLDNIDYNTSAISGKLSFGLTNPVSNYTNSNTAAGFNSVSVDGTYGSSTSGNNLRMGLLNGNTIITGDLNEDIPADTHASGQTNYPVNAFGNANLGTLKLFVNGSLVHSLDLSSFTGFGNPGNGVASSVNGAGSGFTNLSITSNAKFADGTALDLFKHRTGRYAINTSSQRLGWNYANVVHTLPTGNVNTNYVEWINDTDNNSLNAVGSVFDTLTMAGDVRLSGVKYHVGGSAQYRVRVSNAYKNVYSTSNITFATTNCSISSQPIPSAANNENKVLHLTGSATINANSLLNEAISSAVNVPHPLKSNLSSGGPQSIPGILMWAYSNSSTVLSETFRRENYRLISGSYTSQSTVTNSNNTWDSTVHVSGSNTHSDGLIFYNQRLYSPSQGANNGNFGGITNGPSNNVNYSSITSGQRTFFRYFQNNSGGAKTGFSLTIQGSGTIVPNSAAFNSSRLKVYVKLPATNSSQETGFMDLATAFSTGQISNNSGCLVGSLDGSLNATNIATFGTQFVADNEYIVVMIKADASFTGYVSGITVSWS